MGNCLQQGLGTCCGSRDKQGSLDSINENRTCTDVPFFVALFGTWIAMWVFFGQAIDRGGDPRRLTHGIQYDGKVCGIDLSVQSKPYAVWPDLTSFDFQICVESCDESNAEVTNASVSRYFETRYPSQEFFFHCIPEPTFDKEVESFARLDHVVSRGISDLATARFVIMMSLAIALFLSFVYIFAMRCCVAFFVWTTIAAATLCLTGIATLIFFYSRDVEEQDPDTSQWAFYASIAAYSIVFLWICLILFLRKRIQMATEVVRYAAEAVWEMKVLTIFPLFTFALFFMFLVWWFYVAVYLFSVHAPPELTPISTVDLVTTDGLNLELNDAGEPSYLLSEFDSSLKNTMYFHVFLLLWNQQVAVYFTYLVVAGVVADWYFTEVDAKGKKLRGPAPHQLSNYPLLASLKRTLFFHLGTVAYGAFILATIRFIRGMFAYIRNKTKAKNNKLQEAIACCCMWCFKCVECICDKVSKNAFVYNAIYGDNFCLSALGSFSIVWRNLVRAATIDFIADWMIIMGRVYVAAASSAVAAYLLQDPRFLADGVEHVSSLFFPIGVIFIISYTVAQIVMVIYETTVDTVFLCFLVDEERNKEKGMFASEKLRRIVGGRAKLLREESVSSIGDGGGSRSDGDGGGHELDELKVSGESIDGSKGRGRGRGRSREGLNVRHSSHSNDDSASDVSRSPSRHRSKGGRRAKSEHKSHSSASAPPHDDEKDDGPPAYDDEPSEKKDGASTGEEKSTSVGRRPAISPPPISTQIRKEAQAQ